MQNSYSLSEAKRAKNDEFYTQMFDIEKEIDRYLEYDPNIFKDKTVLLPCDDPEWSNFTKYFAQSFEFFGMKKLISTSYVGKKQKVKPTLFELMDPKFDPDKTENCGKIFTLTKDINGDRVIDVEDLEWDYLEGDGDFRSEEVKALRDEADFVITNPPFSLFREFMGWIMEANKQFLIIGNMNAITYKEVFPLIKNNKIWLGCSSGSKTYFRPDGTEQKMGNTCWFTNLQHGRRNDPLVLMSMKENLRYDDKIAKNKFSYKKYDNYDAIEVPYTLAIPNDYDGVMGVPISFLEKYCPDQFEIIKFRKGDDGKDLSINGKCPYFRILIKYRKEIQNAK